MFQSTISAQAADLIDIQPVLASKPENLDSWVRAAEDCVLARFKKLRVYGGLPLHRLPLSSDERADRLQTLLSFWAQGCPCAVDEVLFADILSRKGLSKPLR